MEAFAALSIGTPPPPPHTPAAAAAFDVDTASRRAIGTAPPPPHTSVLLVDNGSLRAESVASLGAVAAAAHAAATAAAARASAPAPPAVLPCSARWSDKAAAPGDVVRPLLDRLVAEHAAAAALDARARRDFLLLPLFVGPSAVVADELPALAAAAAASTGGAWHVSRPLVDIEASPADDRVARALLESARRVGRAAGFWSEEGATTTATLPALAVCDHGSPTRSVAAVRDHVAAQVEALSRHGDAARFRAVTPCSMERRAGAEYDFNEPSLAGTLRALGGDVVVALLFISPGRHAGAGGDIASIVDAAVSEKTCGSGAAPLRVALTPLLGVHEVVPELLAERLAKGMLHLERARAALGP